MTENELTNIVIREAILVHKQLGPGLLENVYKECLYHRLVKVGLNVRKEVPIPVVFEEVRMECGYRADLVVEGKLIIEIKRVEELADIHKAQVLTYLRLLNLKLGLLINFNTVLLKDGLRRIANGM
ncbi:MAG: GxxExxY protein [Filimonas sp.]|nr:GxxExxY protein [Filimonas sp.]